MIDYFIDYKNNQEIRHLCIFSLEMSIYTRYSDKSKCMYFLIKAEEKIFKYMIILQKVSNIMKNN